jgi:L-alanine-DL-glutamate epimerase-like enolase superfamily enzyme
VLGTPAAPGQSRGARVVDSALWDLLARRQGCSVFALGPSGGSEPRQVPCYDTGLYFDDLLAENRIDADRAAGDLVAARAAEGFQRGRAFKVKVGRGARWMSPQEGLDRDVIVVEAVRNAIGPESTVLVDANNGFTLRTATEFLERTAPVRVGWLEEPFHEDAELFAALRSWIQDSGLTVALADGESGPGAGTGALAREGLLDVVQYDLLTHTFTAWVGTGRDLDALGVGSAPHHFGSHMGNYMAGHLAGWVRDLRYVEWDETAVPGLSAPEMTVRDGMVTVGAGVGWGVELDSSRFDSAVASRGFSLVAD